MSDLELQTLREWQQAIVQFCTETAAAIKRIEKRVLALENKPVDAIADKKSL